jgi:hypothetical protein
MTMAENYMSYNRKEFEDGLLEIAGNFGLQVGDYTEKMGKAGMEERVYEVTTYDPRVRILIYSSIDPRTNVSREVGGDAIRINFYCKGKDGKLYYKKFKKHQRINTMFNNIMKSVSLVMCDMLVQKDIEKWLYAVSKN